MCLQGLAKNIWLAIEMHCSLTLCTLTSIDIILHAFSYTFPLTLTRGIHSMIKAS